MPEAFIGLGANIGPCRDTLTAALDSLHTPPEVRVTGVSSLYRTAPVGLTEQPEFFNLVARVETSLEASALLARCLAIEASLGRQRLVRWGPRLIDLDVLWHAEGPSETESLQLPHPRMKERAFVLVPLAELAPEWSLEGETATAMAARVDCSGVQRETDWSWRAKQ